jgi:VWFA-related protein
MLSKAIAGVVLLLVVLGPQQRPPTVPTFRSRADVVESDVSVFDRNGNSVKGLPVTSFTVLEDGKPRPIVGFAEIEVPTALEVSTAWMRDAGTDVETNDVSDRRLFVIVMDDASYHPRSVDRARELGRMVIDRLGPKDLAAVVFTGNNVRNAQGFTSDHGRLIRAVEQTSDVRLPMALRVVYSVSTLLRATEYLVSVPARRKVLVPITSFDMDMAIKDRPEMNAAHLLSLTERMFTTAQRANLNVFVVSPLHSRRSLARLEGNVEARWAQRVPYETAGAFIPGFGAKAAVEEDVGRIFQQTGSYYMIGYSSADLTKFHRIKVVVDKPALDVRARERYY